MTTITLLFDFGSDEAVQRDGPAIQEHIGRLDLVDTVRSKPLRMRVTGLELVAAVSVTLALVRGGREIAEELPKLVKAITDLMVKFRELRNVYVDVGSQRIPIDKLDADHLARLAQKPG